MPCAAEAPSHNRQHTDAILQGIQVRWIAIGVVGGKDRLVGNHHPHARIGKYVSLPLGWIGLRGLSLLLIKLHLSAGQALAMKLIDRFAPLAQRLPELLLFLPPARDLGRPA